MHEAAIRSEPARARRTLSTGVLVFRLAALAWMIVLNVTAGQPFRRPASAWAGIAVATSGGSS